MVRCGDLQFGHVRLRSPIAVVPYSVRLQPALNRAGSARSVYEGLACDFRPIGVTANRVYPEGPNARLLLTLLLPRSPNLCRAADAIHHILRDYDAGKRLFRAKDISTMTLAPISQPYRWTSSLVMKGEVVAHQL